MHHIGLQIPRVVDWTRSAVNDLRVFMEDRAAHYNDPVALVVLEQIPGVMEELEKMAKEQIPFESDFMAPGPP